MNEETLVQLYQSSTDGWVLFFKSFTITIQSLLWMSRRSPSTASCDRLGSRLRTGRPPPDRRRGGHCGHRRARERLPGGSLPEGGDGTQMWGTDWVGDAWEAGQGSQQQLGGQGGQGLARWLKEAA